MKNYILIVLVFFGYLVQGQVKIGDDINSIDNFSILELQSSNKALVLTRVTTAQMLAMTPLSGAILFNIDEQCVYFFDGLAWVNLCDNTSSFTIVDNGDGTFTFTNSDGTVHTIDGAAETVTTIIDNGDGTFTYTNEIGVDTVITFETISNQTLVTDNTPGQITITDGNSLTINTDDADADSSNEIQTVASSDNTVTVVTDSNNNIDLSVTPFDSSSLQSQITTNATDIAANRTAITTEETRALAAEAANASAIAAVQSDVDTNESDADTAIALVQTNLDTHTTADLDLSVTNELTDLSLSGTTLTLSNPATGGNSVTLPTADGTETVVTGAGINAVTGDGSAGNPYVITGTEVDGSVTIELTDLSLSLIHI